MATNAEEIVQTLVDADVEMAFGLPGGEVAALLAACRDGGIRFYLTGHEASAAFMAGVTGQITGIPGVCISTLGPGAINLCLGVANAFLDRQPLVAISADLPDAKLPHFSHQRLPLASIFANFTKLSLRLDGHGTRERIEECLAQAVAPRPGPVYVALPSDVATAEAKRETAAAQYRPLSPLESSDGAAAEEAFRILSKAKTPLLVVGLGCRPEDVPALRSFVSKTEIPFVVTPKAKGALPEDVSGFLGVASGMALDQVLLETLDIADVLFGVGFDPVECDKDWYLGKTMINLDRAPTGEASYQPIEIIGDISTALVWLANQIERSLAWPSDLLAIRRSALVQARGRVKINGPHLSPLKAVLALREVLPAEAILTCDVGSHKYYAGQFWESYEPGKFFVSNGLSGMGYGVPAAIAAKLQFPNLPVVALVGDGGMLMMLHNLTFIRQYHVPVIIVVFVDESLSLIRVSQDRKGYGPYGVDFPVPSFAKAAAAWGLEGIRAQSISDLKKTVTTAMMTQQAVLLEVPINIGEYYEFV